MGQLEVKQDPSMSLQMPSCHSMVTLPKLWHLTAHYYTAVVQKKLQHMPKNSPVVVTFSSEETKPGEHPDRTERFRRTSQGTSLLPSAATAPVSELPTVHRGRVTPRGSSPRAHQQLFHRPCL